MALPQAATIEVLGQRFTATLVAEITNDNAEELGMWWHPDDCEWLEKHPEFNGMDVVAALPSELYGDSRKGYSGPAFLDGCGYAFVRSNGAEVYDWLSYTAYRLTPIA